MSLKKLRKRDVDYNLDGPYQRRAKIEEREAGSYQERSSVAVQRLKSKYGCDWRQHLHDFFHIKEDT